MDLSDRFAPELELDDTPDPDGSRIVSLTDLLAESHRETERAQMDAALAHHLAHHRAPDPVETITFERPIPPVTSYAIVGWLGLCVALLLAGVVVTLCGG